MMTREEFKAVCDVVGGKKAVAEFVGVTVRAVEHWLAGSRKIQTPEEALIRELHRQVEASK
ncbi:MAG: YdaS family helix-turn-helix protein [Isosphaeraceae bacterium]